VSVEEIEARRAARKAEAAKAEAEQFAKDLEALDALEVEHGDGAIGSVKAARFVPGLTTRVFFRSPEGPEYDRYAASYGKATTKQSTTGQRDALALLGRAVWLYPKDEEAKKGLVETFPGLLVAIGLSAAKRAEAAEVEEGKG
jgi:hypothetical protein